MEGVEFREKRNRKRIMVKCKDLFANYVFFFGKLRLLGLFHGLAGGDLEILVLFISNLLNKNCEIRYTCNNIYFFLSF